MPQTRALSAHPFWLARRPEACQVGAVPPQPATPPAAHLISLGCAKNTVDSQRLLALLVEAGFLIAEDPRDADLFLVNTCGFIEPARRETADVLAGIPRLEGSARRPPVVALGCMVEQARRNPGQRHVLRHADAWVGFEDYPRLARICSSLLERRRPPPGGSRLPPAASGPNHASSPGQSITRTSRSPRAAPIAAPSASYPPYAAP
jgi:tRNA A37 methylthiotransferase MiaB